MADIKNPYDIRAIYERMSLDLIASMRRTFLYHQGEELKEGFQWEQWQLVKLREIQKYRVANSSIIGQYSDSIETMIQEALENSFKKGERRAARGIKAVRGVRGLLLPKDFKDKLKDIPVLPDASVDELPRAPREEIFFNMNDKKLKALTDSVTHDIKKAQHGILRKMDDIYRQTIYKSQIYLDSGAVTLNQAIDMATKDFLVSGINCITYKDGKRANIASYAEMVLRTTSQRATFLGEGKKRDEWGLHLVVVSSHGNTCDMCSPWQGKVLIDDVYSSGKPDGVHSLLSAAMAAGLLHPNCRHTLTTYFPGITQLPEHIDDEEALANYEAEQKQRGMERNIRKYKRLEVGSLDAENVNRANNKVKEWKEKLKQHLKDNPQLRRDYSKLALKNVIEKAGNNDILNDKKWFKSKFSTPKKFDKHIKDHLHQYGVKPEQYVNIARDLLAAPISDDIEGFIGKDRFLFKYRKSSNDFAIGRPDGNISTLFKPDDGYKYWQDQIAEHKE